MGNIHQSITAIWFGFFFFFFLQAGGFPEPEIVHYNPKDYDFGKLKSFPFRDQVFIYYLFMPYIVLFGPGN